MSRVAILSAVCVSILSLQSGCSPGSGAKHRPAAQRQSQPAAPLGTAVGTLGADFSINASGAATYSIAIEVPPGTNGAAPALHAGYDSQAGNGLLGMGFTLRGLSSISRCAANQRLDGYIGGIGFNDLDRFCLDGQRLVKVSGGGGYGAPGSVYHTERETWTKVVANGACGSGPCFFEAWNKDGRVLRFGADAQSRVPLPLVPEIASWQISSLSDLNGNTVSVVYEFHPLTLQIHPTEIRYTSNAAAGLTASRFVRFEFEARPDATPRYVGGFLFQQDERLRTIRTFAGDVAVLEFRLAYQNSAGSGQSLLKSIQKCAADKTCYPPTTFDWLAEANTVTSPNSNSDGRIAADWCKEEGAVVGWMDFNGDGLPDAHCDTPQGIHRVLVSNAKDLKSPNSSADGTVKTGWCAGETSHAGWADFNGDGRGDLTCNSEDGTHRVLVSDGAGVTSPNSNADGLIKSSWCASETSHATWGNFNADGRADLLCARQDGTQQALISTSKGVTSPNTNADGTVKTSWCMGIGPVTFWSDFNGDHLADLHCSKPDGTQQVLLSDARTLRSPGPDPEGTVRTDWCAGAGFSRGSTDFNGDGLVDSYCQSEDGRHLVLLSTGKKLISPNSNADGLLKTAWCAGGSTAWADFNGDGLMDLTCSESSGRQLVLLSTGSIVRSPNASGEGVVKTGWCKAKGAAPGRADFNGDGFADFTCREASGPQFALIHTPGFADMVSRFTDGLGGVNEITYSPLTDRTVYSKGAPAVYPLLAVVAPVRVASAQVTRDGRGGEYRFTNTYSGARTDLESGSWLGFERIRSTETATGRAKELVFVQSYPVTGYVSHSRLLHKELLLASSAYTPTVLNPHPNVYQVLNGRETYSTFTNGKPDFENVKSYAFDSFGNAALISDTDSGDASQPVFICYKYANDETNWRLGYVLENKVTRTEAGCKAFLSDPKPAWNAVTDLRWNGTEFDGAMNTRVEKRWDDRNQIWLATTRTFNAAGGAITVTDPSGATTDYRFDSTLTFPLTVISPVLGNGSRLSTSFRYSEKFGVIESVTDPNGNEQVETLDGFGRVIEVRGPDPSSGSGKASLTLRTVQYLHGTSGRFTETRQRPAFEDAAEANWDWSRLYVDGLGRQFRTERRGTEANQTIVVDTTYDAAGRVSKESFPRFSGALPANTTTEYDLLNRPTRVTTPNGVVDTREYIRGELEVRITTASGTPQARRTLQTRDARANLVRSIDPLNSSSTAEYNPLSETVSVVRGNGSTTAYEHDSLGRIVRTADSDTGVTIQRFNETGRLDFEQDAGGNRIAYEWDPFDRIVTRTVLPVNGPAEVFRFGYDDQAVANGLGNLTFVQGPQYSETYSYTRYGLVGTEKLTLDGLDYVDMATYDPLGRQRTREFPDGSKLRTNYYVSGPVLNVEFQERGANVFKTYGVWTGYNALEQPGTLAYGNGSKTAYQYFPAAAGLSRLQSSKVSKPDGSNILSTSYEWDANNEIRRVERRRNGGPAVEETYEHNPMGWLSSAAGPWGAAKYTYDANGNIASKDATAFTYRPKTNLLLASSSGAAFEHDLSGNLTGNTSPEGAWKYGYDGDGRLRSISRNGQERARHLYDEAGNRLKRIDGQGNLSRYISQDFDVFEAAGKLVVTRYIRAGSQAIAAVSLNDTQASLRTAVERQAAAAGGTLYSSPALAGWLPASLPVLLAVGYLFGLLLLKRMRRSRARAELDAVEGSLATEYSRRHPWYTRLVPILIVTLFAATAPMPVGADLGPGKGYPTAGTLYFHGDHLNSSVLVTDESGIPKTQVTYDPYGKIDQANSSGPDNFRPKFTTQEWDQDSELYYFGARYYDPVLGRFIQPDPKRASVSPYVYADGDPEDFTDPDGEQAEVIIALIVIGAIVGAYSGGAAVNESANPFLWDWSSGRTLAGFFAGAAIGAAGGAISGVSAMAGPAVGILGEIVVGAGENAAYAALGGGSTKDIAEAAVFGAGMGALTAGVGAGLGRGGAKAAREGESLAEGGGGAASTSRFAKRGGGGEAGEAFDQASVCASFPAGTQVALADGRLAPIESIQAQSMVLGQVDADTTPSGFAAIETTSRYAVELIEIRTAATSIQATPEHLFWAPARGWTQASALKVGDQLLTATGGRPAITSIQHLRRPTVVHNFEVEAAHSYFVSPELILVHNPSKLKSCKLSKLPATKTTKTATAKAKWNTKIKSLVAEFGDKNVRYYDPPSGRRWLDIEEYALELKSQKAVVSLASFKKGSSRPQHFSFGNKKFGSAIAKPTFKHTNPYKGQYSKIMRFTWHHHPEKKTMAFVPTQLHKKLGHEGSFKHLF